MRFRVLAVLSVALLFLAGAIWTTAQEGAAVSSATCAPVLETIWTAASDACINGPLGFICNGGAAPAVAPGGTVGNALAPVGALVELGLVDALRTPPISEVTGAGVLWMRHPAPIQYTALLIGDVNVTDVTPPDFPAWQSIVVQTGVDVSTCPVAPHHSFMAQTPFNQPVNIVINGVSVTLNGTLLVQTTPNQTVFAGLSGVSTLFALGQSQTLRPGQEILVGYATGSYTAPQTPPGSPIPLDTALSAGLPVALLDRPIILPQPGYVSTDGPVNLRVSPSTDAGVILQVPAGQVLSVLGRSTGGDWYHVRLDSGETGWMFANLLVQNVGDIQSVYDATPLPPQRYGEMGRIATVFAPAGANMRAAPDVTFPLVMSIPDGAQVTLLARSPYSPWIKVDFNGVTGWLALITLETEAVIESLPIDYNVPPPPPPTREPGSFGNAFPDPNGSGN
ncbi:MAG: SH3 domain-containing protein [Anaerolineae bacterium]|nr:SH3 domain-containing protein [Anaerolineae bacterium]